MEQGVRYTLNHLGDIVVGGLERIWLSVKGSTTGFSRRYTLYELSLKRETLVKRIGERVTEIQGVSPKLDIFDDEILSNLFTELGQTEARIWETAPEKEEKEAPFTGDNAGTG